MLIIVTCQNKKYDSDKPKEEVQFQPKNNVTFLAPIAPDSDFKMLGKSYGLWLVSTGMQLQIMCLCASSSKWWQVCQYECAGCSWLWGPQMKVVYADLGNTLNVSCPNTVCQK